MSTQVYLTVEKSPLNLETRLVELFSPESEELAATEQESQDADRELTLLERLDRRQNDVMAELDRLEHQIQSLVKECQSDREAAKAAEAA